jgi:hypothetical protein
MAAGEVVYIILIKLSGEVADADAREKNRHDVTRIIRDAKGECTLYRTAGAIYDYVSVIKNVDAATAIKAADKIEELKGFEVSMLAGLDRATK